jgi:hypothetical protein
VITEVSGEWTVPTLDCSATPNSGSSAWVGTGGDNSGSLLQTGIDNDCVNGVQQNVGWWELYPSNPNYANAFSSFPVAAGDTITAEVFYDSSDQWVTKVTDLATGLTGISVLGLGWEVLNSSNQVVGSLQGETTTWTYNGGTTAEWIEEDYGLGSGGLVPFADYTTVTFTNLSTSIASWQLAASDGIEMIQSNIVISTPTLPGSDGFSVSYTG